MPLPQSVVAAFEKQALSDLAAEVTQDTLILIVCLIMVWGALRFSDAQRVEVGDLQAQDGVEEFAGGPKPRAPVWGGAI